MNAMLFNVGLWLTASLAVVQLCAVAFSQYARFTAVEATFTIQVPGLTATTINNSNKQPYKQINNSNKQTNKQTTINTHTHTHTRIYIIKPNLKNQPN